MREILFRGKREDNGEWVYGFYVRLLDVAGSVHRLYVPADNPDEHNAVFDIVPETVGQFTGLTDKNGNRIFEGDIVETFSEDGYSLVGYDNIETEFGLKFYSYNSYSGLGRDYMSREIEIIGNIHDNPELLERE